MRYYSAVRECGNDYWPILDEITCIHTNQNGRGKDQRAARGEEGR